MAQSVPAVVPLANALGRSGLWEYFDMVREYVVQSDELILRQGDLQFPHLDCFARLRVFFHQNVNGVPLRRKLYIQLLAQLFQVLLSQAYRDLDRVLRWLVHAIYKVRHVRQRRTTPQDAKNC